MSFAGWPELPGWLRFYQRRANAKRSCVPNQLGRWRAPTRAHMKPFAICTIFKNEAPFLLEWIAYHHAIGFDQFVLYDNDSTDGGADVICSSWAAEVATVLQWPRRPGQLAAYRHFIYNFSPAFEWVAFIDVDEFLLPLHHTGIRDLLCSWQGFSGVLVHWRSFGPSGFMEPPAGLMIENYDLRSPDTMPVNHHVKSIVRSCDLLDVTGNPHEFQVKGSVCNTSGLAVNNVAIQPVACHENLVLNHYVTRSRHDWLAKIRRGSAMFEYKEPKYQIELFNHYAEISQIKDESIKRFAPMVRASLDVGARNAETSQVMQTALPDGDPFGDSSIIAHLQYAGDVDGRIGEWIGLRGSGRWIEGFSITPRHGMLPQEIEYQIILGADAILPWLPGGTFSGSRGLGLPLRGFRMRLRGAAAARYNCACSATFAGGVASGLVPAGQPCVATNLAPLEAFRIVLRPRTLSSISLTGTVGLSLLGRQ